MSVLMRFFICLLLSGTGSMLVAAPTDIAIAPLAYLLSAQVKPNLMFILDDSGSMQWSYRKRRWLPQQSVQQNLL